MADVPDGVAGEAKASTEAASRRKFLPFASAWLPIVAGYLPLLAIIFGGLFTAYTYFDAQKIADRKHELEVAKLRQEVELKQAETQRAAQDEQAKASKARFLELQRPFIDRHTALYFETAEVIGKLMTTKPSDKDVWEKHERRYWALYYSELAMVEHCEVAGAMAEFGSQLKKFNRVKPEPANADFNALGNKALDVAHALREGMFMSWSGELPKRCADDDVEDDDDQEAEDAEAEKTKSPN